MLDHQLAVQLGAGLLSDTGSLRVLQWVLLVCQELGFQSCKREPGTWKATNRERMGRQQRGDPKQ